MARLIRPVIDRFWSKVDKKAIDDCWNWIGGSRTLKGYGVLLLGGRGTKTVYTHRFSYELHKGTIKEGINVCHTCDNPKCVNPKHLFEATQSDNLKDMVAKGRAGKTGPKKGTGAKSKLTVEQLIALKEDAKIMSQTAISIKYDIGQSTVSRILLGLSCQNIV